MIGCATEHYTTGHGDIGQFILQQAIRHGGVPTTTNGLPVVTSRWRYLEDEHGMQIHLPPHDYPSLEAFLDQAFAGKAQFGPSGSPESRTRIHEYRMAQKGGHVGPHHSPIRCFTMSQPNKPDSANPAMTVQLTTESQWRRVADLER